MSRTKKTGKLSLHSKVLCTLALSAVMTLTPAAAKTLVYCSEGSPENWGPSTNTTGTTLDNIKQVYSNLTDFKRGTANVGPSLATSWRVSPDGKEYRFSLRTGVKWHTAALGNKNFKPSRDLNADDVVFSFERQAKDTNPYFKVTSANHTYYNDLGFADLIKKVEKIDDHAVKFTLANADSTFLPTLAMQFAAIQSKEYADAMLKAGTPEKLDNEPVGTGPFQMVQYQKDAIVRYKAFPQYFEGKAKIDDLIFAITKDASVRWAKLKKGECHVMPYPNPADLGAMRANPNIKLMTQAGDNVGFLAFNTVKKPFDDVRVRRAISMAIDRKAIMKSVYQGTAQEAKNPIPPGLWSYNNAIKQDAFDVAKAKKLLADAGLANGFKTELWYLPVQRAYNPNGKRMAELMQADLAKIGITVETKTYEWGEYRKRMQNGEHAMGMWGWTQDIPDPDNFLGVMLTCNTAANNGSNVAKFCNKGFDDLINKAKINPVQAERAKLYEQAQVIFKEQLPWMTIAHAMQIEPVSTKVIDFRLSPLGRHTFHGVDIKE